MRAEDAASQNETAGNGEGSADIYPTIAYVVREMIESRIEAFGGNKSQAARTLGISLKTLYNRLAQYKQADRAAR